MPAELRDFLAGTPTPPEHLYLLAGHQDLHLYEADIMQAVQKPTGRAADIPGCFYALMQGMLQSKLKFDYIIVDMSPSAWVVNKLFVSSCDILLVPCSCDFFSSMAVRSLGRMLLQWDSEKEAIRQRQLGEDPRMPLPKTKPIFLGHTFQLLTVSGKPGENGKPAKQFEAWINRINHIVQNEVVPKLERRGMTLPFYSPPDANDVLQIGALTLVRNTQSIGAAATKCHVPVWVMNGRLCKMASAPGGDSAWSHGQSIAKEVGEAITRLATLVQNRWPELSDQARSDIRAMQDNVFYLQEAGAKSIERLTKWEALPLADYTRKVKSRVQLLEEDSDDDIQMKEEDDAEEEEEEEQKSAMPAAARNSNNKRQRLSQDSE